MKKRESGNQADRDTDDERGSAEEGKGLRFVVKISLKHYDTYQLKRDGITSEFELSGQSISVPVLAVWSR